MTEKKKRAPGGGRKPLPESEKLQPVTVRLTPDQVEHCRRHGDLSKYVRSLIESQIDSATNRVCAGSTRGGARERAGRPPAPFAAITVRHRRCRSCGRFISFQHDHRCTEAE